MPFVTTRRGSSRERKHVISSRVAAPIRWDDPSASLRTACHRAGYCLQPGSSPVQLQHLVAKLAKSWRCFANLTASVAAQLTAVADPRIASTLAPSARTNAAEC